MTPKMTKSKTRNISAYSVGQFDTTFSAWVHQDELEAAQLALSETGDHEQGIYQPEPSVASEATTGLSMEAAEYEIDQIIKQYDL